MSSCKAGKQSCAANMTPGPALYPWDGLNLRERQDVHVLPSGYATGQVTWIQTPVHRVLSSFLSGSSCLEHTFPSAHCPSAGPWISKNTALSHTLQPHRHFCDLSPEACRALRAPSLWLSQTKQLHDRETWAVQPEFGLRTGTACATHVERPVGSSGRSSVVGGFSRPVHLCAGG